MKKNKNVLIEAKKKGYYVDMDGNVYSSHKKLKLKVSQDRYYFSIRYYKERTIVPVHKFVAYLKYDDQIFKDGIEVRHLDNNSLNNKWDNIGVGSHSDNMMDMLKNDRIKKAIFASKEKRRFSNDEVEKILLDRKLGMKYKDLCEKYDTSKSTLSYLFNHSYYSGIKTIS